MKRQEMAEQVATSAGLIAAHAVWCIADGATLIPILALDSPDGSRTMQRLVHERLEEAVAIGKEKLETNPEGATKAVLVYDGFVTLAGRTQDALIMELRVFMDEPIQFQIVLPYRQAKINERFAVYRPKFVLPQDLDYDDRLLGEAFFTGVSQHEKGAKVWNDHLDESV